MLASHGPDLASGKCIGPSVHLEVAQGSEVAGVTLIITFDSLIIGDEILDVPVAVEVLLVVSSRVVTSKHIITIVSSLDWILGQKHHLHLNQHPHQIRYHVLGSSIRISRQVYHGTRPTREDLELCLASSESTQSPEQQW